MKYIERNDNVDIKFVLAMFNTNMEKEVKSFIEYIKEPNNDVCLERSI